MLGKVYQLSYIPGAKLEHVPGPGRDSIFLVKSSHNTVKKATYSQVYRLKLQRINDTPAPPAPPCRCCYALVKSLHQDLALVGILKGTEGDGKHNRKLGRECGRERSVSTWATVTHSLSSLGS